MATKKKVAKNAAKGKNGDKETQYTEFDTPTFRLNWAQNLFEAKPYMEDGKPKGKPKYACEMMFDEKGAAIMKAALIKARKKRWPNSKNWTLHHNPLINGDEKAKEVTEAGYDGEYYEGMSIYIARTEDRPTIVGTDAEPLEVESDIYSGCYCRAKITIGAYQTNKKNMGVTLYLNGVQKVRDGDKLGGRGKVQFEVIDTSEDDVGEGEF